MSKASISFRESIRWLPDEASEPTQTVVLTGLESGVFLDVRFDKQSGELDWAFAGYRTSGPAVTKFTHHIDSRTLDPLSVVDVGTNTLLPDRTTLEAGEMVNPATGKLTAYEEVWRDEECESALIMRMVVSESSASDAPVIWRARVGNWQLALGRSQGEFWAWQASRKGAGEPWTRGFSTRLGGGSQHDADLAYLPDHRESETVNWEKGSTVEWLGERWEVLVTGWT